MLPGTTFGQKQPPASLHLVEREDQLQGPNVLGLRCQETRQLQCCERHRGSFEVCDQNKQLRKPRDRGNKLSQIQEVEKRIEFRMGCAADETRSKYRRLRRGKSCHSSSELEEAGRLPTIFESEKEETCWIESDSMDSDRFTLDSTGFSESGELVEQQPWFPTEIQAEAIMDLRRHEPWEDFIDDVFDEIL